MNSLKNKTARIGIVTVLYDSDAVLPGFFSSLAKQKDVRFRLYVIDNSKYDTGSKLSAELASKYDVDVQIVFNGFNGGIAKGNNQGIALALKDGCSHVLLANNDTEFEGGTLFKLFNKLNSKISVVTPKFYYYGTEKILWYAGGSLNLWTMRTPHIGRKEVDSGRYNVPSETTYAPTCFMLFDIVIFKNVGMMDETFFVYYDDTDYIYRLTKAGIKIWYFPDVLVQHKVAFSTGGDFSSFSLYYANRNRLYFIRKHLQGVQRVIAMCYFFSTLLPRISCIPISKIADILKGVRDGLALNSEWSK